MATPHILITGDYWHKDFQSLIADIEVTTTLVTLDKLERSISPSDATDTSTAFDVVVIAQSRQGQFTQNAIDAIVEHAGITPVVMLLGSWCEGERRSDNPIEGVKRVFWHQWQGRFEAFVQQLKHDGISFWHSPTTSTDADDAREVVFKSFNFQPRQSYMIGVSAWNVQSYQSIADACQSFGWQTRWIERSSWVNLSASIDAICVDAGSQLEKIPARLSWLQKEVADAPIVLTANFPRLDDIRQLEDAGACRVVSKPFELNDLRSALESAIESAHDCNPQSARAHVPVPKMLREQSSQKQQR